jgi:hypothetical protein
MLEAAQERRASMKLTLTNVEPPFSTDESSVIVELARGFFP